MIKEEESSSMKLPMMINKIILELVVSLLALDPSIHLETSSSYCPSSEEESSKYLPQSLHLHTIVFHGQFGTMNVENEVGKKNTIWGNGRRFARGGGMSFHGK